MLITNHTIILKFISKGLCHLQQNKPGQKKKKSTGHLAWDFRLISFNNVPGTFLKKVTTINLRNKIFSTKGTFYLVKCAF